MSIRFQNVSAGADGGGERTRIQLCGRLSVEVEGLSVVSALRGRQVPLLLAYLILNRDRQVSREELIDALWPAQLPRSQDAALRTLLSRLRSALGATSLVGRDELSLQLPLPVWIDFEAAATEVERALQALARGDARGAWALAQVPINIASRGLLPGASADWLEPRRRELEEIRLQALEVVGRAGIALGGPQLASVQRAARNLIEAEPYRESGHVLLMEALAAQGNVAEALLVFERLRGLLRKELGTAPSPEALAAHERLLHPQPATAASPSSRPPARRRPATLPPRLRAEAQPPLVGRRRELHQLTQAWERARAPALPEDDDESSNGGERLDSGVVLLAGEPGIGKTRLLAELAAFVHERGAVVLAGRCPAETLIPYQPFIEALRPYLLSVAVGDLRASVGDHGSQLARLVPDLRRRLADLPDLAAGEPESERYWLFEAVAGLLDSIAADQRLLLVLDDLHWADRPSLLLLRHLARAASEGRFQIAGAYRSTDVGATNLAETLSELHRERLLTQLHVSGLDESETGELIGLRTGRAPPAQFSRELHAETAGNPLFIEEILRHQAEAGLDPTRASVRELRRAGLPDRVKEVISRRLTRLDANAIEALRIAAVIGREFDLGLLERLLALPDEEAFLSAFEPSLAAGLVAELPGARRGGRYAFSHALVRDVLYDGMSAPRRGRLHRRVGEALEADGGDHQLAALALHFARAEGPPEKAIGYALAAGEQATTMLAHEEAISHYARALALLRHSEPDATGRRCEVLLALGEAQVRAGEQRQAERALREAAILARRLKDGDALARAAIGVAGRYIQQSGVVDDELITMLFEALRMTAGHGTRLRVVLLARLCGALYYTNDREQMKRLAAEAQELATRLGDLEAQAVAAGARRRAQWEPGALTQRLESSTEMLTLAREGGNLELALQAHAWLVVDLLESGDRDAVDAQVQAFTAGAQALREPLYRWQAIVWQGTLALLDGRVADAEAFAGQAVSAGAAAEYVTSAQYYAAQMLAVRQEQGRMAELEAAAAQFVQSFPTVPAWRAGLAWLRFDAGRPAQARDDFEAMAAHGFADLPRDGNWVVTIAVLSELCAALGDRERAARLYELLAPHRNTCVVIGFASVCLGSVGRYLGLLAGCLGRLEEASEHFESALRAVAALRAPPLLARTQLSYAAALPDGPRARELADAASAIAAELQLSSVARRAAELQAR